VPGLKGRANRLHGQVETRLVDTLRWITIRDVDSSCSATSSSACPFASRSLTRSSRGSLIRAVPPARQERFPLRCSITTLESLLLSITGATSPLQVSAPRSKSELEYHPQSPPLHLVGHRAGSIIL
jgi:hypothetical protein